jgi:hypothetical protein
MKSCMTPSNEIAPREEGREPEFRMQSEEEAMAGEFSKLHNREADFRRGQTMEMVEHYAKQVNQKKLARAAILKWEHAGR